MRIVALQAGASRAEALQAVIAAEREGLPFLITSDAEGGQLIAVLEGRNERAWIGREATCDLALAWDDQASRVHAALESVAGQWTIVDDGLSQNGTFLRGERINGRYRLRDGDALRIGATTLTFRRWSAGERRAGKLLPLRRRPDAIVHNSRTWPPPFWRPARAAQLPSPSSAHPA